MHVVLIRHLSKEAVVLKKDSAQYIRNKYLPNPMEEVFEGTEDECIKEAERLNENQRIKDSSFTVAFLGTFSTIKKIVHPVKLVCG